MNKLILLLVAACGPAGAITISSIQVTDISHSQVHIRWNTDVASYCRLQWGTASGTYTYASISYGNGGYLSEISCAFTIGGLAPNTQYYFLPSSRPNLNNATGICNTSGCGATEQPVLTLADPAVHPVPPIVATPYAPTEPDTTGYTIVTMRANASTNNCEAAAPVSAQTNWTGAIAAGDSIQTVFNKIWYKTVVRFPQGIDCWIPATGTFHAGVTLSRYTPDGGPNDWVVVETVQNSPADFPPFGSRIGPEHASKLATLRAYTPGEPVTPPVDYTANYAGQIFECNACGANHIWFRNFRIAHRVDSTLYPSGVVEPPVFTNWIRFATACAYVPVNLGCPADPAATSTPHHTVIDRILTVSEGAPSREFMCWGVGGNYWAVIGTYCTTEGWAPEMWPHEIPWTSGAVIHLQGASMGKVNQSNSALGLLPAVGYAGTATTASPATTAIGTMDFSTQQGLAWQFGDPIEIIAARPGTYEVWNADTLLNATGTVASYNSATGALRVTVAGQGGWWVSSTWVLTRPATVTFSGANVGTYAGHIVSWLSPTGIVIDYATASGVTAACVPVYRCSIINEASPSDASVPANSMWFFNADFNGAGAVSVNYSLQDRPWKAGGYSSGYIPWRPMGLFINPGRYGLYSNNFMEAIGQTIYADSAGDSSDISFDHNLFFFPRTKMQSSPTWNGYGYTHRNVFEPKQIARAIITGNIIDGAASNENPGQVFYLAGTYGGPFATGVQDIMIRSNLLRHVPSVFQCAGGGSEAPADPGPSARIELSNNLILDVNRDIYQNQGFVGTAGEYSGLLSSYPMCTDINFHHNTVGRMRGVGPALLLFGAGSGLTSVLGEGLNVSSNVLVASKGDFDYIQEVSAGQRSDFSNFPVNPLVTAGTWVQELNSSFLRAGTSVSPSWNIAKNIMIGGERDTAPGPQRFQVDNWTSLTQAQVNTLASNWPGTTDKFPSGASFINRLTAAGWPSTLDVTSGVPLAYRMTPNANNAGDVGANIDDVIAAAGIVTGIKTLPAATAIGFAYTAPDARACTIDVSSNGTTWTRFTDAGGARGRTLAATGLTAATAYQYRLLCYFDQSAAYEFTPDQITSGTATTLASATRTVVTGFGSLPATATQALITMTPLSGSSVSATCTTSPCSVASVPVGTLTRTIQPQTSGAVAVGPAITSQITVQ